jgi:hypothetical protein
MAQPIIRKQTNTALETTLLLFAFPKSICLPEFLFVHLVA